MDVSLPKIAMVGVFGSSTLMDFHSRTVSSKTSYWIDAIDCDDFSL